MKLKNHKDLTLYKESMAFVIKIYKLKKSDIVTSDKSDE